ncbi:hypothetical protein [Candidatus Tisiphia endosymbiont of Oplodontha viridula]
MRTRCFVYSPDSRKIAKNNENHAKLMAIPGVGLITATALTASIGSKF